MKFENILHPTQHGLFRLLTKIYRDKVIKNPRNFILVKGTAPILLVAHMDTVHRSPAKDICKTADNNIWMSPQGIGGDDRCGIWALMECYKKTKTKPWLLFTCDEETGGHGADAFTQDFENETLPTELKNIKLIVEIDRKGSTDAVYYECDNKDLETYIESKGFHTDFGSFSDISIIAPSMGIAAVNLSSGYYNPHTQHEYIVLSELENTINTVIEIINESTSETFPVYPYIEKKYPYAVNGKWAKNEVNYFNFEDGIDDSTKYYTRQEKYNYLKDIYDKKEIDDFIKFYGETVIDQLFMEEFGEW